MHCPKRQSFSQLASRVRYEPPIFLCHVTSNSLTPQKTFSQDVSMVNPTRPGLQRGWKTGLCSHVFRLLRNRKVPWVLLENVPGLLLWHLSGDQPQEPAISYVVEELENRVQLGSPRYQSDWLWSSPMSSSRFYRREPPWRPKRCASFC